jgi:hypothetical protein
MYGTSTGELLNTLVYNDNQKESSQRRYQKIVWAWKIPESNIEKAKKYIYQNTDKLLVSIDHELTTLSNNPTSEPTHKVGLGTYYIEGKNHEKSV